MTPASGPQLDYIRSLQRQKKLTDADLRSFTEGVDIDALTRQQASELLDLLINTPAGELGRMAMKSRGQLELA